MRKHYQIQEQECASAVTHIANQLERINALLIDKLIENQPFVESLAQLQVYYQTLHAQQQQQVQDNKAQVAYLNARLADELEQLYNEQYATFESASNTPTQVATTETSPIIEPKYFNEAPVKFDSRQQAQQSEQTESVSLDMTPEEVADTIISNDSTEDERAINSFANSEQNTPESPTQLEQQAFASSQQAEESVSIESRDAEVSTPHATSLKTDLPVKEKHDRKRRKLSKSNSLNEQLLPRYRNMSLSAAVATVVQDNVGKVCTPDSVARALYGEREGKALTNAKARVGKILWNGARQGRWKSVPGQLGMYALYPNKLH